MNAAELVALDRRHLVHPMSGLAGPAHPDVTVFAEGHGIYLVDVHGEEYLDGIGGLMNVEVGYGRAELGEAAAAAMAQLGFSPFFWRFGNAAASELGGTLAELTPPGIERFFFTGGGSEGIETVIKLVRYANVLDGRPAKTKIVGRHQSYHGMSLGALSLTGQPAAWEGFGPLVPGFSHIPQPTGPNAAEALESRILDEGSDQVAAFIAEPISGPSGFVIPPDGYWRRVAEICRAYDVLLVMDEVMSGFGRTGRMFASEHWSVEPDLMVLSKGITSGYFPLGAVGMTGAFFERLAAHEKVLVHGFTSAGHPVGCAVALANLGIIEREGLVENAASVGRHLGARLEQLAERHEFAGPVRNLGMIGAIDVRPAGDRARETGPAIERLARERRLLLRAYGDTIAVTPSLVVTPDDVDAIVERLESVMVDFYEAAAGRTSLAASEPGTR